MQQGLRGEKPHTTGSGPVGQIRSDLPIVFMSGYVDECDASDVGQSQCFLRKPFTHDELVGKLTKAVSGADQPFAR